MAWRLLALHGSEVDAMAWLMLLPWRGVYAVAMALHGDCCHHMAWRLSPCHGLEVVAMAWLGGCRHRTAWRLPASHGMEVVRMASRLSPWHGLCCCHGMAYRLLPWLLTKPCP